MSTYSNRCLLVALLRRIGLCCSNLHWRLINGVYVCLSGIRHGAGLSIRGRCYLLARRPEDIVFGEHVTVESRHFPNTVGLIGPSIFHAIGGGRISVGDRTGMSSPVISSRASISIGSRCLLGGNVRIFDHDFHALEPQYRLTKDDASHTRSQAVEIGNDVFIGTNAMILKGTRIGDRSIVAAGSVVFGLNVPPDSLVRGNPAVVESRSRKEGVA